LINYWSRNEVKNLLTFLTKNLEIDKTGTARRSRTTERSELVSEEAEFSQLLTVARTLSG